MLINTYKNYPNQKENIDFQLRIHHYNVIIDGYKINLMTIYEMFSHYLKKPIL